jgi:hypothetical protein
MTHKIAIITSRDVYSNYGMIVILSLIILPNGQW